MYNYVMYDFVMYDYVLYDCVMYEYFMYDHVALVLLPFEFCSCSMNSSRNLYIL